MIIFRVLLLILISSRAIAGGASEEVNILSLKESRPGKYTLEYNSLKNGKRYIIYLSYNDAHYSRNAEFLTQEKFDEGIRLLKSQVISKETVRFGWFGAGPCLLNKDRNIFKSDALDLYVEPHSSSKSKVVYAFCEYR
jgi:hypothetical protein